MIRLHGCIYASHDARQSDEISRLEFHQHFLKERTFRMHSRSYAEISVAIIAFTFFGLVSFDYLAQSQAHIYFSNGR
jgi:hypothetical protein